MSLLLVPILSLFRESLDQGNQAIDKNSKILYHLLTVMYIVQWQIPQHLVMNFLKTLPDKLNCY